MEAQKLKTRKKWVVNNKEKPTVFLIVGGGASKGRSWRPFGGVGVSVDGGFGGRAAGCVVQKGCGLLYSPGAGMAQALAAKLEEPSSGMERMEKLEWIYQLRSWRRASSRAMAPAVARLRLRTLAAGMGIVTVLSGCFCNKLGGKPRDSPPKS